MSATKTLAPAMPSLNGATPIPQLPGERIQVAPSGRAHRVFTVETARAPRPALAPMVGGLFMPSSVYIVVGKGGVGKTYSACDLAVCVATGEQWLGRDVIQGGVLIVDEQNGQRRISDRVRDVLDAHEAPDSAPVFYESLAHYTFYGRDAEQSATDLAYLIRLLDVKFVVVDSLTNVIRGAEERDNEAMRDAIEALRVVADNTGSCIVVLHHTNKINEFRGATNIRDQSDGMLIVRKDKDNDDGKDDGTRIFESEKARDLPETKFAARMNFEPGRVWLSPCDAVMVQKFSPTEKWVIDYMRDAGGEVLLSDMVETCKGDVVTPGGVRKAVERLTTKAIVRRVGAGGKGVKAVYRLEAKFLMGS